MTIYTMANMKFSGSRKTAVILLLILFLVVGGTGSYLLWRVNQQKTVAPTDSEASEQAQPCNPPCGNKPDLANWARKPYNQSMKEMSDSSRDDGKNGYSIPSEVVFPKDLKGEIVLYYKSLEDDMRGLFELNDVAFEVATLDANKRHVIRTGITLDGIQARTFTVNSKVVNGSGDFANGCPGRNSSKYWSLGWIPPLNGMCGTTFGGPPQGGRCTPYVPVSVASDIQWVQSTGHRIISQQCWGDWMEWKGDYDFNDYFLIIAVDVEEPPAPPKSADLSVAKSGESLCRYSDNNAVDPRGILIYTITVKNTGDGDGEIKSIVDTLDSKVVSSPVEISDGGVYANGKITWTFSTPLKIAANGEKKFTYKINVSKENFGTYDNQVVVTKGDDTTMEADATVTCTCDIASPADLVLTKVGSSQCFNEDTDNPYAVLSYTIKLSNNGEGDGAVVKIVDTLDSKTVSDPTEISEGGVYADGKITWTFNPALVLKKNEEKIFTYKITVAKENFGTYKNTVIATKPDGSTIETDALTECLCHQTPTPSPTPSPAPTPSPTIPSDIPEQPKTGLFDESENIVTMGAIILFVGLGWTWLSDTYSLVNGKLVQRRREGFEKRVVKR